MGSMLYPGLQVLVFLVPFTTSAGPGDLDWGYEPENGPSTWAANYPTCGGKSQSPININDGIPVKVGPIRFNNYKISINLTNRAHTLSVDNSDGVPSIEGAYFPNKFQFLQLHMHWGSDSSKGSEHTLNNKMYPGELHLVHWNTKYADPAEALTKHDGLAVLGMLYEVSSEDNPFLTEMIKISKEVDEEEELLALQDTDAEASGTQQIVLDNLLPDNREQFYFYKGSLTTPSCDEIVLWTVFKDTVQISENQLKELRGLTDSEGRSLENKYRPVQPLYGRKVFKRYVPTPSSSSYQVYKMTVGLEANLVYTGSPDERQYHGPKWVAGTKNNRVRASLYPQQYTMRGLPQLMYGMANMMHGLPNMMHGPRPMMHGPPQALYGPEQMFREGRGRGRSMDAEGGWEEESYAPEEESYAPEEIGYGYPNFP